VTERLPIAHGAEMDAERVQAEGDLIEIGQWYYVLNEDDEDGKRASRWFACVVCVGSNYVELRGPKGGSTRIHINSFASRTIRVHDYKAVITGRVHESRADVERLLAEVNEITSRLGLRPRASIEHRDDGHNFALATLSNSPDVESYKQALVRAKDKELPELFKEIESANERLVMWMKAEMIPLEATTRSMKNCISEIDGRVFNVTLYAGLTEQVKLVRKGKPADVDEKLRLMQRRLYMDEECLLSYQHGGMEFSDIREFDKWLSRPEIMNRIFPYRRCMVAMRVRRNEKDRSCSGYYEQVMINIKLAELDKSTFLYIRNGERIYRLVCDLEFSPLIFPPKRQFDFTEPVMVKTNGFGSVKEFMPLREFEERKAKADETERLDSAWRAKNSFKKWLKDNPGGSHFDWERLNPHRERFHGDRFRASDWDHFNETSVYYDDAMSEIKSQAEQYNRIALIVQGLFDRTDILQPHPQVKSWTKGGFDAAIELVYDGSDILQDGDAPDFDAYRARCNTEITDGSVLYGQEKAWAAAEAKKENERRRRWRSNSYERVLEHFMPQGDSGPGYLAKPAIWHRTAQKATFIWMKGRRNRWGRSHCGGHITARISVPVDQLFNVSAYKPGDFLQFFRDPRTREDYLKWAPMLLAAEEYHAGNLKAQEPNAISDDGD
jgi:hypothetical protein